MDRFIRGVSIIVADVLTITFFLIFMKTDAILKLSGLIALLSVGFYGYRRAEGFLSQQSESFAKYRPWRYLIIAMFTTLLPFVFKSSPYLIHICIMACLYIIMAVGLNFCLGSSNMTHFAASAFFGMGAYCSALFSIHFHTTFWINILLASMLTGFFGILLAIPIIKTKTYYLALISMAFGLIFYQFIVSVKFTGGPAGLSGIPRPSLFGYGFLENPTFWGISLPFQANYFYVISIFTVLALILAHRIKMSWVGLQFNLVREDEIATACQGIQTSIPKIQAFCLNAILTGFAGAFYAHYITYVGPPDADIMISVVLVIIVILGGMDNLMGITIAAVLLTVLPEKFRAFQDYRLLAYGIIVLLMLLFRPSGLFPMKLRVYQRR